MNAYKTRCTRGLRAAALLGGLLILGLGVGVTLAAPLASNSGNPFQAVLDKLDQVLAAIAGAATRDHEALRWDRSLPAAQRFVILSDFNGDAVLDKNTGLVWEKSVQPEFATWSRARFLCLDKVVGGQRGWRLPSVPELSSLVDSSVAGAGPSLPPGHPFIINYSISYPHLYWSATTNVTDPSSAWSVVFTGGGFVQATSKDPSGSAHFWCVRGAMSADQY
jgi:hypothetical protein